MKTAKCAQRKAEPHAISAGVHTTQFTEDFKAIAMGVILIPTIPWRHVFRHYVKEAGARWG